MKDSLKTLVVLIYISMTTIYVKIDMLHSKQLEIFTIYFLNNFIYQTNDVSSKKYISNMYCPIFTYKIE